MKTRHSALLRIAAAAAVLATSTTANAVLLDHGPLDPVLTFPIWYRDLNGLALQQCRSSTESPNAAAGLAPMCFPLAPNPAGFAGNVGDELFYQDAVSVIKVGGFSFRWLGALEMAYGSGTPVRGQEMVFARIRVVMSTSVPGTYKVTHPYGVEVFPDVGTGPRAVFFTEDVGLAPGNFEDALSGRVGPFLQWDQLLPGETLTVTNAAGATEEFTGDPNYDHTFTGSPFGTNFIRIDGPVGSNLDGAGNDFIQTPIITVLGQKFLGQIPQPLKIKRSTYTRDPAANITSIDVWAQALPAAKLVLTATDAPSVIMKSDGLGNFMAHVEMPATTPLANFVTVTNMSDSPATSKTSTLSDVVSITKASYDTLTKALSVTATSSDTLVPGPALAVAGPFGGSLIGGAFSAPILSGIPPTDVTVLSTAAGQATTDVLVVPGLPDNKPLPPVALADTLTVNENVATLLNVLANDSVTPPAAPASILIITPPASGTAVASTVAPLTITYTPSLNYSGPDSLQYVVVDSAGSVSNIGNVTLNVVFAAFPPTAVGDNWAQLRNTARTVDVIGNDKPANGTTIDPASVVITTPPASGTAVPTATGGITYTPALNFTGSVTFSYTVKNTAGQASAPATVFVFVSATAETLSPKKVLYTTSKAAWTVVGSTNIFGPGLTPKVTCWVGKIAGVAANLLGTAPVDVTGAFSLVPVGAVPPPDATKTVTCQSTNLGIATFAVSVN